MLALLLAVMMLVPSFTFTTFAEDQVAIKLSAQKSTVEPGAEVDVNVSIDTATEFQYLGIKLSYDNNVLELISVTENENLSNWTMDCSVAGDATYNFFMYDGGFSKDISVAAGTIIATAKFKVKDDATTNATTSVTIEELTDDDFYNNNGSMPANSVTPGTITIASNSLGSETEKATSVAQLTSNNKYYTSIADALSEASTTDAVTLVKYVTLDETDTVTIPADKAITLNLDGYKLTGNVINMGTLTLEYGTVNGQIASVGTLNINDSRVYVNGGIAVAQGGTANISAGTVTRTVINSETNEEGITSETTAAIVSGGTLNISGGSFESTVGAAVEKSNNATVTITGGSFKGNDANNPLSGCSVADGHSLVKVGNTGWYQVQKNYGVSVELDKTEYQAGESVTATVYVTPAADANLRNFNFTLATENLTLSSITSALESSYASLTATAQGTTADGKDMYALSFNGTGGNNGVSIKANAKTAIATLTLTAADEATLGGCTDGKVELSDVLVNSTGDVIENNVQSDSATAKIHVLHKITIMGSDKTTQTNNLTLYAKYGDNTQLYTKNDTEELIAATDNIACNAGYWFVGNKFVKDESNSYNSYADLAEAANTNCDSSLTVALNVQAIEKNITWSDQTGVFSFISATEEFVLPSTYTVENDVKFKVNTKGDYAVNQVYYTVGSSTEKNTITPDNDGVYTIATTKFTNFNDIAVCAETTGYAEITLNGGDNATLYDSQDNAIKNNTFKFYVKSSSTDTGVYADKECTNSNVTLPTVKAKDGYRLDTTTENVVKWDNNGAEVLGNSLGSLTSTATLTPKTIKTWSVTFNTGENGSIASGNTVATTQTIDNNKVAAAPSVTPAEGYAFAGWYVGETKVENVANYQITSNTTFTAKFERIKYTLSLTSSSAYSVSVMINGEEKVSTTGDYTVEYGQSVSVTITANDGHYIKTVTVNGTAYDVNSSTYTADLNSVKSQPSISVATDNTYTVTFNADENGYFDNNETKTQKTITVNNGGTVTAPTPTAKAGWTFKGWEPEVNTTVTASATYTAKYERSTITITTTVNNGVPTTDSTHEYGEAYTISKVAGGNENGFTVITGAPIVKCGETTITATYENGKWTVPAASVTGNLSVSYDQISVSKLIIVEGKDGYKAAPEGKNLVVLQTNQLNSGYLMYSSVSTFYYSERYGGYAAFIDAGVANANGSNNAAVLEGIAKYNGNASDYVVSYMGDISGNGAVTSVDAGIVNDVLHCGITNISDLARLMMDVVNVNATEATTFVANSATIYPVVTSQDIKAILNLAVGLNADSSEKTD